MDLIDRRALIQQLKAERYSWENRKVRAESHPEKCACDRRVRQYSEVIQMVEQQPKVEGGMQ